MSDRMGRELAVWVAEVMPGGRVVWTEGSSRARRVGAMITEGGHSMASFVGDVTFVGLDVHLSSITAAATVGAIGELVRVKLPGDVPGAVEWVRELPGERKRVTYEAGPCGFGLARALTMSGVDVLGFRPQLRVGQR